MSYKQLINFDNYYIYDDGRIYSIKSKRFLMPKCVNGYLEIGLINNDKKRRYFRIHRLVFEVFKGEIPDGLQIDHINGIRDDNRLINLRLLSPKENIQNKHHLEIYKEIDKEFYKKTKDKQQKYREEHKQELKEYQQKYREEHKQKIKEYHQKYREEHKQNLKEYHQKYVEEHKQELKEYHQKYWQDYYQEHKENITNKN